MCISMVSKTPVMVFGRKSILLTPALFRSGDWNAVGDAKPAGRSIYPGEAYAIDSSPAIWSKPHVHPTNNRCLSSLASALTLLLGQFIV